MNYWLFKTEPDEYSISDLKNEARGYGIWDGIRNYQARNFIRDQIKTNDKVFIYHSQCKPTGIVGTATVVKSAYPDPSQYNAQSHYFDSKATEDNPRWFCLDIAFEAEFEKTIPLSVLKKDSHLQEMILIKQGRLSIQPVHKKEWDYIHSMLKNTKK